MQMLSLHVIPAPLASEASKRDQAGPMHITACCRHDNRRHAASKAPIASRHVSWVDLGPGLVRSAVATLSRKLHDHGIDGEAVAGLGLDGLDHTVALGTEDILHLHGLHHAQGLAGFDLLALG